MDHSAFPPSHGAPGAPGHWGTGVPATAEQSTSPACADAELRASRSLCSSTPPPVITLGPVQTPGAHHRRVPLPHGGPAGLWGNSQELSDSTLLSSGRNRSPSLPCRQPKMSSPRTLLHPGSSFKLDTFKPTQTLPIQATRLLSFCYFLRRENNPPRGEGSGWQSRKCLVN